MNMEKILGYCSRIMYFFVINLLFLVCNLPVIAFLIMIGPEQVMKCLPLFLIALWFMAPALSAVFFAMYRLVQGHETGAFRDFKKGYADNFVQSMRVAFWQLLLIFILITNIRFFTTTIPVFPLRIMFAVLFCVTVLVTPYLYLLIARYKMKDGDVLRTALACTIGKPVFTMGNAAALLLMMAAFEVAAGVAVLFMGSVYGFLVVYMNKRMFDKLEEEKVETVS